MGSVVSPPLEVLSVGSGASVVSLGALVLSLPVVEGVTVLADVSDPVVESTPVEPSELVELSSSPEVLRGGSEKQPDASSTLAMEAKTRRISAI